MPITPSLRQAISSVARKDNGTWMATSDLVDFADLLRWKHDRSLASIVRAGQDSMLRDQDGGALKIRAIGADADDRYDAEMKSIGRDMLDTKFGQIGNPTTFLRSHKRYRYVVFLSNWPADALLRAQMLASFLQGGMRFGEIVLFGSAHDGPAERSLAQLHADGAFKRYSIPSEAFLHLPTSEIGAIRWLVDHTVPQGLIGKTRVSEVVIKRLPTKDGGTKSGSTRSSLQDWREVFGFGSTSSEHKAGDVLAITNGWQFPRGRVIVESELLSWQCGFANYRIDTVGAGPGFNYSFAVRVEEFNRFLYEVNTIVTAA